MTDLRPRRIARGRFSLRSKHHSVLLRKTEAGQERPRSLASFGQDLNYEDVYKRLIKLIDLDKEIVEIVLHPINYEDPETKFFTSEKVRVLLSQANIVNYRNLI